MVMAGCASGPPTIPYPAFVQVDELTYSFMASLPGVRPNTCGRPVDTRNQRANRPTEAKDWKGTSGGEPGRLMEIFVIAGELMVADIPLVRSTVALIHCL